MSGDLSWRGVGDDPDEDRTDLADPEDPTRGSDVSRAAGLRLARSARRLVGTLLRPRLRLVVLALVVLVLENAVMLAGPLLVAVAIDTGVPAALDGRPGPLAWSVAGYAVSGLAAAGLRASFLLISGRLGQDVLLELRDRVFRHAQRLALDWHESYTSGRLISRLTATSSPSRTSSTRASTACWARCSPSAGSPPSCC